jgi:hypothetical protein
MDSEQSEQHLPQFPVWLSVVIVGAIALLIWRAIKHKRGAAIPELAVAPAELKPLVSPWTPLP